MTFANRKEAANMLAAKLADYKGKHPLILAIPRGAVPMAKVIAEALDGDLDVVLVRKLGAPWNPEYAIGSVDESGDVTLNAEAEGLFDEAYLDQEVRKQLETIGKRRALYTPVRSSIDLRNRTVIVVDDGIATGSTMLSALHAVRTKKPKYIIAAIGVAPRNALAKINHVADEVVCLHTPAFFSSAGEFFDEFTQVEDEEVIKMLR